MKRGRIFLASLVLLGCGSKAKEPTQAAIDAGTDTYVEDAGPPPPPKVELGRHTVKVVSTRKMIPGPGLPAESPAQTSNNNLDVIRHEGRVYLAWRTGPNHFASSSTAMYVLSSTDETTWKFETKVVSGADLREPRFLSLPGEGGAKPSLFLYLARLGNEPNRFEPQGMSYVRRNDDGTWGSATEFYRKGFIDWRAKMERGTPYLVAYLGGEHIYTASGVPLEIELLTTKNGIDWVPVDPAIPVVSKGGGSETDFAIGDDGTLYAVIRNEAGDSTGFGSKVCRAPAGKIASWTCKHDPRKYDSPIMFWYDGEAYLIGRRQVTANGYYDLEDNRDKPIPKRWFENQLDYRIYPKRCALWRYVQAEDRIAYVLDLPSKGDTCFPGILRAEDGSPMQKPGELIVYDYSSDIDGPDIAWNEGQLGPTNIYRHVLSFEKR